MVAHSICGVADTLSIVVATTHATRTCTNNHRIERKLTETKRKMCFCCCRCCCCYRFRITMAIGMQCFLFSVFVALRQCPSPCVLQTDYMLQFFVSWQRLGCIRRCEMMWCHISYFWRNTQPLAGDGDRDTMPNELAAELKYNSLCYQIIFYSFFAFCCVCRFER